MSLEQVVEQLKKLNEQHLDLSQTLKSQMETLNTKIEKTEQKLELLVENQNKSIEILKLQVNAQSSSSPESSKSGKKKPQEDNTSALEGEEIVTINVGGKIFTTTKETLCQKVGDQQSSEHYFAAMFNCGFTLCKDEKGNIVIDRDPKHFRRVLNYLRCGGNLNECVFPFESELELKEIELEARFYGLMELVDYISCRLSNKNKMFDTLQCTSNLEYLNANQSVKHLNSSWATVRLKSPILLHFTNAAMATQTNYFEVRIDRTENQNIMIGLINGNVDLKSAGNNWIGNFKDSYSFYCFDGRKYNSKTRTNGYGEECSAKDSVGIWVDVAEKKIYYYRNGRCLGLAAENVPLDQYSEWYFGVSLCDKECQITILQDNVKPPSLPGIAVTCSSPTPAPQKP